VWQCCGEPTLGRARAVCQAQAPCNNQTPCDTVFAHDDEALALVELPQAVSSLHEFVPGHHRAQREHCLGLAQQLHVCTPANQHHGIEEPQIMLVPRGTLWL
jgi:hypothetical protein